MRQRLSGALFRSAASVSHSVCSGKSSTDVQHCLAECRLTVGTFADFRPDRENLDRREAALRAGMFRRGLLSVIDCMVHGTCLSTCERANRLPLAAKHTLMRNQVSVKWREASGTGSTGLSGFFTGRLMLLTGLVLRSRCRRLFCGE
jgi:hypothetical protein